MYLSFFLFLLFLLVCGVTLFTCRRHKCIQKVCSLTHSQKCELLNSVMAPFGYLYDASQDVISNRCDAWQRNIGYTSLFDRAAVSFHMVFDCLPVYFDYAGRTWLLEFWKGQYGINTGAEIGLYYSDRILEKDEYLRTRFRAVSNADILSFSYVLSHRDSCYAQMADRTWWLTSFSPGLFANPSQLTLHAAVAFPNYEMLRSFLEGLLSTGFSKTSIKCCGTSVQLCFENPPGLPHTCLMRFRRGLAQFHNRLACRLYQLITGVFCLTLDRLVYLYYLLPRFFRRLLCARRYRGHSYRHCAKADCRRNQGSAS